MDDSKIIENPLTVSEINSEIRVIEEENPLTKTLNNLLSDDNIEKKTELDKPLKWSALKVIEDKLTDIQLVRSAKVIHDFRENSFRYLISYKREGIREKIEALQAIANFQLKNEETENQNLLLGR